MLINCPKCGFTQPKDQYCARCGVDIASYKTPVAPLGKRLSENYIITGGFSLFILSLAFLIILQSSTGALIGQKISLVLNISKSNSTSEKVTQNTAPTDFSTTEKQPPSTVEETTNDSTATTTASTSPSEVNPSDPLKKKDETKASEAKEKKLFLKIFYLEISKAALIALANESRNLGQFNEFTDYATGHASNLKSKVEQGKILYEVEKPIESGKSVLWHLGPENVESDPDLGISYSVEVNLDDPNRIRGSFDMIRSWKDKNPQGQISSEKKFYSGTFDLPPDLIFYFAGGIPHQTSLEQDFNFTNSPPFQILRSAEFKAGQSELLVLLSFERK